jgi:hypothetical protein
MEESENKYEEAIAFFQQYSDQWDNLIKGLVAKRNVGFDDCQDYLFKPDVIDRKDVTIGIMQRMTMVNEIIRDFAGDYEEPQKDEG